MRPRRILLGAIPIAAQHRLAGQCELTHGGLNLGKPIGYVTLNEKGDEVVDYGKLLGRQLPQALVDLVQGPSSY